jgi:hypothetical protein
MWVEWSILTGMNTPPNDMIRPAALRSVLATQRDLHTRQRELVRASLVMCPGKTPPSQPR